MEYSSATVRRRAALKKRNSIFSIDFFTVNRLIRFRATSGTCFRRQPTSTLWAVCRRPAKWLRCLQKVSWFGVHYWVMKIFYVKKGCKWKSRFVLAEDITKYRITKINYSKKNPSSIYRMFHKFISSSRDLMRGVILCEQSCNSFGSIVIGFRACVQEGYDHITYTRLLKNQRQHDCTPFHRSRVLGKSWLSVI